VLALAGSARSRPISSAAWLLAGGWLVSIVIWRCVGESARAVSFAALDAALAGAFLTMARGRLFPAPLFVLHAALVFYHVYARLVGSDIGWVGAFLNRAFEMALIYVGGCALFRILALRRRRDEPMGARPPSSDMLFSGAPR
jgi:hypothetical protein